MPDKPAQLVFKALQTYSSGEIVRWIELATSQDPNPDTPAPILTLDIGNKRDRTHLERADRAQTAGSSSTTTAETLAIVALVLSAGSVIGVAVLVLRGRRKPGD